MTRKFLHTSDLARAVGVHPNTVRKYADWGLIPPVERTPSGYRLFTQQHLDCMRLARLIYSAPVSGPWISPLGNEIVQHAVMDDWQGALEKAHEHLAIVQAELQNAEVPRTCWSIGHKTWHQSPGDEFPLAIGEVSKLLGVSIDVIRNAERNGLITVPRNTYNNYRLFGKREIERLRIIRMLGKAGYSHMAILRMFLELDKGNIRAI